MNKKLSKLIPAVCVLILILTGCQMEKQPKKIGDLGNGGGITADETPQIPQEIIYTVGDIISIDETILVVLGWDQPPGGDFNPPDDGKKYLVVDIMIANAGEKSINSSPVFQMTLKDSSGQKYNLNRKANIASGSNTPNGEISPGEVIRGKVGFHVPEEMTNFTFVYEANLVGLGEVSINLGATPMSMNPPSDLNLAQRQKIYLIGDLIEISDLTIQIIQINYPEGTEIVKPREEYKFVAIDIQVENQGETVQEITSIVQMYLKDNTGEKFTFHLGAQSILDSGLPDDELQPGERVRGQIGFQVPDDSEGLMFVFDAEVFGFGKVFIALD